LQQTKVKHRESENRTKKQVTNCAKGKLDLPIKSGHSELT